MIFSEQGEFANLQFHFQKTVLPCSDFLPQKKDFTKADLA
jgi:hypothetical protein